MRVGTDEAAIGITCGVIAILIALNVALAYGAGKVSEYFGHPFWLGVLVWVLLCSIFGVARGGSK